MLLLLPIVYQSFANKLIFFAHIVAIVTNSYDLLYQWFTNHYQSDPMLYMTSS